MVTKKQLVDYLKTVNGNRRFYDDGWANSCVAANYARDVCRLPRGFGEIRVSDEAMDFILGLEIELEANYGVGGAYNSKGDGVTAATIRKHL